MNLAARTKADGAALAFSFGVIAVISSLASLARAVQPLSAFRQSNPVSSASGATRAATYHPA